MTAHWEGRRHPPGAPRRRTRAAVIALTVVAALLHRVHGSVCGIEKVWRQLDREGIGVDRDRVARLMQELGLEGVVRGKRKRTTVPGEHDERLADWSTGTPGRRRRTGSGGRPGAPRGAMNRA